MKLRLLSFFTAVMAVIAILTSCANDLSTDTTDTTTTTVAPEPQIEISTETTNKSVSGISKDKKISSSFGGSNYDVDLNAATATFTATADSSRADTTETISGGTSETTDSQDSPSDLLNNLPTSFSGSFFYDNGTLWLKADVPSASGSSLVLSAKVEDLESDSVTTLTQTFTASTDTTKYESAKTTFTEKAQETIKTEIDKIESSIKDAKYSFDVSKVSGNNNANNAINVKITAYSKTFTVTIKYQKMEITMGDDTPSWFKVLYSYLASSGILNELTNLMSNSTSGNSTTNNTMSKYPNITAFLMQMMKDITACLTQGSEDKAWLDAAEADIANIKDLTNDITVSKDGLIIKMDNQEYAFILNIDLSSDSNFKITIEATGDKTLEWVPKLFNLFMGSTESDASTDEEIMNAISLNYPNVVKFCSVLDSKMSLGGGGSISGGEIIESSGSLTPEEKALFSTANELLKDIDLDNTDTIFTVKAGPTDTDTTGGITLTLTVKLDETYDFTATVTDLESFPEFKAADSDKALNWLLKLLDIYVAAMMGNDPTAFSKMYEIQSDYPNVVAFGQALMGYVNPNNIEFSGFLTENELSLFSVANGQLANVDLDNTDTIFTVKAGPTDTDTTGGMTLTLTVKLNDVSYDFTATVTTGSESFPTFTAADSTNTLDWLLAFQEIYVAMKGNDPIAFSKMYEIQSVYPKVVEFGQALVGYVSNPANSEISGFLSADELKLFEDANKQLADVDLTSDYSDPDEIFTVIAVMTGKQTEDSDTASEMVLTLTLAVTLSDETYNFYATVTDSKNFPEFKTTDSTNTLNWLLPLLKIYADTVSTSETDSDMSAAFKMTEIESKYPKVAYFGKTVFSRVFAEISNSNSNIGLTDEEKTLFADAATQLENIDLTGDNIAKIFAVNTETTDTDTSAMTITLTVTLNDASYDFTATVTGSDSDSYPVFKPTNSFNTLDWLVALFEMNEPSKMMEVMNSYPKVGEFCQVMMEYLSDQISLEGTE